MSTLQDLDGEQCQLILKIRHFLEGCTTLFTSESQSAPWNEQTEVWEQLQRAVEDETQLPAFESTLSALQLEIWRTLKEWWHGEYHNTDFKSDISQWRQMVEKEDKTPQHSALGPIGQRTYHWCMSGLFFQEVISCLPPHLNTVEPKSGFSMAWVKVRVSTIRKVSLAHAATQRLAQSSYRWVRDPSHLEQNTRISSINLEVCPWLESPWSSADIPNYLWDIEAMKTVRTHDLEGKLDYVCVSHTWGRWRTPQFANVENVPWLVPKNTRFEVDTLPTVFANENWPTKYLWFDLFCIPQDESLEANIEIAKQSIIFRKASSCIIWMNDVESWAGAELAIACFGLFYLRRSGGEIPHIEEYLTETSRKSNGEISPFHPIPFSDTNTIKSSPGWLSSLWTLQEAVLCPQSFLANRKWNVLTHRGGIKLTLENIVFIIRTALEGSYGDEDASWLPQGPRTLYRAFNQPDLVEPSRLGPFVAGSFRSCTGQRAEAIMSAMGITDWYTSHIRTHGTPPAQDKLVLDKYPLDFVRETAQKLGAAFYFFTNRYHARLEGSETAGSMLPIIGQLGATGAGAESLVAYKVGDHHSHQSIATWQINLDGSARIKKAAIIASRYNLPEIDGEVWVDYGDGFQSNPTFQKYLENRPNPCHEFAVSLCQRESSQLGLLLRSFMPIQDGLMLLRKVGIFMSGGVWCVSELAIETEVNWLVI